jgi:hypothetical protein
MAVTAVDQEHRVTPRERVLIADSLDEHDGVRRGQCGTGREHRATLARASVHPRDDVDVENWFGNDHCL